MKDLNKHILIAMKYLSDKDSVSKEELEENRATASAADYNADAAFYASIDAAYDIASAADAANAAAANADYNADYAANAITKYFRITGENKQNYIDAIESDKKLVEKPAIEHIEEWIPAGRCNHMHDDGRSMDALEEVHVIGINKKGLYVYQNDKSTCYYSDSAERFSKLKSKEDKEREAFIEAAYANSKALRNGYTNHIFRDLFNSEFTAPKGDK